MKAQLVLLGLAFLLPSPAPLAFADDNEAVSAAVRPQFFNPTLHQEATIELSLKHAGPVSVSILDSSGATVRILPVIQATADTVTLTWDGVADGGGVVRDDAYFLSVRLAGKPTHQPLKAMGASVERLSPDYSRVGGLITYRLQNPSYVTLTVVQGSSRTGESPRVLKRIVDHEPRTAGPIVETWHGFGDGGVYLPDLAGTRLDLVAEPLPENALITVGSRRRPTFLSKSAGSGRLAATAAAVSSEAAK